MQKYERQLALKAIIAENSISSQIELAERLTAAGFTVTQASVSRDLDELGIGKQNGRYLLPDPKPKQPAIHGVVFHTAGADLIVGKCLPGLASAIAVQIDAENFSEIVGTIAGDDTIFVAVDGVKGQSAALHNLQEMFGDDTQR